MMNVPKLAAIAARMRYAGFPPNWRYSVRISGVFTKRFGRR
jgi:hypothetical protein